MGQLGVVLRVERHDHEAMIWPAQEACIWDVHFLLSRRGFTCLPCADLGLLDLLQFQSKLPGLLLYAVALGGYSGDALLQRGSISTLLSQAENAPYNLNFTLDPINNHRVWPCPRLHPCP